MNTNTYLSKVEGLVYQVTNRVNGKVYIGQTIGTIKNRIDSHIRNKRNGLLGRSIRKYGKDNFTLSILYESKDVDTLNVVETYYINELKTKVPNGYNIVGGGGNTKGYIHKKETKELMSKNRGRYLKESNHFYGKKHTEESKIMMSQTHKGKTISDEQINKTVLKTRKKVINLDTLVVYDSVIDAGRSVNKAPTNITRACKNPHRSVSGYRWSHYEDYLSGLKTDRQKQLTLF